MPVVIGPRSLAAPLGHQRAIHLVRWLLLFCCSLPACSHGQETAEKEAVQSLHRAAMFLEQRDFDKAAQQATEGAKLADDSSYVLQRAAEILYLSGHSEQSLPLFDRVVKLVPEEAPQNWQRGIALCSCGKFAEGAKQFETHHRVNPDDVENSAWYFLCIAKTEGIEAARKAVIPSRGDGREPMMSVLQMLQQKLEPEQVLKAAEANTTAGPERQRAQFYAALYVGLYYDSLGDPKRAADYLQQSLGYGDSGYMVDAARVYLADRFPSSESPRQPQKE